MFWIFFTVFFVLTCDQVLKFYIKTNFHLGEDVDVIGDWFKLHFVENPGMAFGILPFGGKTGKIILTVFRLLASGVIIYYLRNLIKEKAHTGLIILVSLILAGALGNIIDSIFYGRIFSSSEFGHVATFLPKEGGYAPLMMGKVVDMLYFPLFSFDIPEWVPFKGGDRFHFFNPVFNIADAAISVGVFTIILFRRALFSNEENLDIDEPGVEDVIEEEGIDNPREPKESADQSSDSETNPEASTNSGSEEKKED
ncbi:lipoprotein signal peptidase [bacterium]|nr:lipoprotein signal peptidase [bacterium]